MSKTKRAKSAMRKKGLWRKTPLDIFFATTFKEIWRGDIEKTLAKKPENFFTQNT